MKRYLMITAVIVIAVFGTAFEILEENGKAGYTGSPSELTCIDCHSTYGTSNSGPGTIYLTSTMNNWQYVPGQTYTINVVVKQIGKPLFGLGFEALTSSNTNAGTLQITNSVKTQTKTKTISGVSRNNVVHKMNGGLSSDSSVFTFNWVAPATNVGNVNFYFSGIAANNDGSEDFDYVYHSSKLVTPASATGLSENVKNEPLKLFQDIDGKIVLQYSSSIASRPRVEIYDMAGHLISSRVFDHTGSGSVQLEVERPFGIQKGVYMVNLLSGDEIHSGKIILQ